MSWGEFQVVAVYWADQAERLRDRQEREERRYAALLKDSGSSFPAEGQRQIAQNVGLRKYPCPPDLVTAQQVIQRLREYEARAFIEAYAQGRFLGLCSVPGAASVVCAEDFPAVLNGIPAEAQSLMCVMTSALPAKVSRKRGEGPKTAKKRRDRQDAEHRFVEAIKKTHPYSPWKNQTDAMKQIPELTEKDFRQIWAAHATHQMKSGVKDPNRSSRNLNL